ncbi:MAG TPA: tripartite tricarboxylate transporter TctB family protein [Candidatus Methylomirabilis sp.]|nr:tripartite tricarboxylate transporter TctB family protein [Candidatus Methylomirabilis sp.]
MKAIAHDRAAALAILAGAVAYLVGARRLVSPAMADPLGPTAFPTLLGGSLTLLAVLLLLFPPAPPGGAAPAGGKGLVRFGRSGLAIALLVGNTLTMEWLGYPLSTFAFLLGALAVLGEKPWPRGLLFSLSFTAALYLLFGRVLHLTLPVGTLFGGR